MNDLLRSVAPPGRPASRPARNDAVPITQRADEIARLLNDFIEAARQRLALPAAGTESQPARDETLRRLVPLAEIMKAELNTLPGADRAADALQTLAGFEERYGTAGPYAARVLRARLAAYQQLGRIDEAARIIPQYVNADPAHAGPLLQSLYEPLVADYERAARENSPAAQSRAETALLIARQLVQWSQRSDARVAEQDRYAFRVQLGESLLRAGKLDEAKAEFAACLALDAKRNADGKPHDARVLFGHAEAAYRAGNYEAALPEFNQAFRRAPDGDPLWWRALLRDLQCRTALQGDPNDILKVIRQQRTRHPDLGGEAFKRDFDALFEENTKRLGH
jgi:tetratricopeptide (TPR) repeat protein